MQAYRRLGAVHGTMLDYRANAEDLAQDTADQNVKISAPTLALWGATPFGRADVRQAGDLGRDG